MDNATPSPIKSGKRVIIRIDPVPDVLNQSGTEEEIYNYAEPARYVTPNEEIAGPSKSSLKVKRRQSTIAFPTTHNPVKHASMRRLSDPTYQHADDTTFEYHHKEIQRVEEEVIPEHHQVLYDLLGSDKAESILNPKIEEPAKTQEVTHEQQRHRRKLPQVDTGLGADALWKVLKKESDKKLNRMDKRIPQDWKISYGAFLRENITENRPLIQRSFTEHTDVPELSKLLDARYKERVRKARHHTNVMFRSSENNKNKTTLLLNNNPVPDYNDREGTQAITRYFDESMHLDDPVHPPTPQQKSLVLFERHSSQGDRIRLQFKNLRFLTENAARTKGRFYGKYASNDAAKMVTDIPGYRTQLPPSMREQVTVNAPVHDLSASRLLTGHRRVFSQNDADVKRDPKWQPLTVGALMEYASTKHALGLGEFRQGQTPRWRTSVSAHA